MSNLVSIQSSDHAEKVANSSLPVILDFSAQWCSPCKRLAPILEDLASEWVEKTVIYTVDADSNAELVSLYGIMSLPTLVLVKGGKETHRLIGLQTREKLMAEFGPHL